MLIPTLLLATQAALPDSFRRTAAVGEKDAYVMLPPQTVCDGQARDMVWSADGSTLVVVREAVQGSRDDLAEVAMQPLVRTEAATRLRRTEEIVVWSAASRKGKVVLALPSGASVDNVEPVVGSDLILLATTTLVAATGTEPEHAVGDILTVSAGTGTVIRLDQTVDGRFDAVSLSPVGPMGVLVRIGGRGKLDSARFFNPNGALGEWVPLSAHQVVGFNRAGQPGLRSSVTGADGKRHRRFQPIDPSSGRLGEVADELAVPAAPPVVPVTVYAAKRGAAPGGGAPTVLLAAKGGKPEEAGIVTTDGERPLLSPKFDAVAYVGQGVTLVRPLVRIDLAQYAAARLASLKALAMNNAKQTALGLMMYAADMDENLPGSSEFEKLGPYVKDSSILDSFTYTYGGGSLGDIVNPADTQVGYVAGPGGRAVAYADGHVKWIPDGG